MIKRIIIYFLALLGVYNIFLYIVKPKIKTGQSHFQSNVIRGEEYLLHKSKDLKVVFVGTSLSYRMKPEYLPNYYYNLSFSGGSIYSGIEIILKSKFYPKTLAIETNWATRPLDDEMVNRIFPATTKDIRQYSPALFEKNQPVNVLINQITGIKYGSENDDAGDEKIKTLNAKEYSKQIIAVTLDRQKLPDIDSFKTKMEFLKKEVQLLQKAGVRVVFYETPEDCQVRNQPFPKFVRDKIHEYFPPSNYQYLPEADCSKYSYSDGEHLEPFSAKEYAKFFTHGIDSLAAAPAQ